MIGNQAGPGQGPRAAARPGAPWLQRLTARQRQFALLAAIAAAGVLLLWVVFTFSGGSQPGASQRGTAAPSGHVTNIGVMPPGGQVNSLDEWVGQAGRKLAQYESERDEQGRLNKDRQAFESRTMQRFAEIEKRLSGRPDPVPPAPALESGMPPAPRPSPAAASTMPPAAALPVRPSPGAGAVDLRQATTQIAPPPAWPGAAAPPTPAIARVLLADRGSPTANGQATSRAGPDGTQGKDVGRTVSTYLPVSFTRGILLGGLDAPTGGQSQSNPHPVLIRLSDNTVLPNQFRGEYRECFVIAAGYGDISAERAYLRTESLSCVRADGATLEVRIQGTVYGEDGKVGMRGRLVTKQGQMLANALLAGVVSGIGQGLSTANTSYSSSPLGTVASTDSSSDAYRAGLGSGVGKALDRLAQYYIKLAENTFPVIEIDASREVDVVITKGVRIDVPMTVHARSGAHRPSTPETRYLEPTDDDSY